MVRCGLVLEPIEAKKAEKRKGVTQLAGKTTGGKPAFKSSVVENLPQPNEKEKGKTRDKVAKEVGFGSGRQYEKAKKVYNDAPEPIKKHGKRTKSPHRDSYNWFTAYKQSNHIV